MRRPRLPMETKNEIMLLAAQLHHIVEEQKAAGRAGGRVQLLAALVAEAAEGALTDVDGTNITPARVQSVLSTGMTTLKQRAIAVAQGKTVEAEDYGWSLEPVQAWAEELASHNKGERSTPARAARVSAAAEPDSDEEESFQAAKEEPAAPKRGRGRPKKSAAAKAGTKRRRAAAEAATTVAAAAADIAGAATLSFDPETKQLLHRALTAMAEYYEAQLGK